MEIKSVGGVSNVGNVNSMPVDRKPVEADKVTQGDSMNTKEVEFTQSTAGNKENKANAESVNKENHLKSVLSMTNEKIRWTNTRCEFEYHEVTKRVSIKVIDKETDEVIREIPPEESLEMVEKIWELAGLIVDEKC